MLNEAFAWEPDRSIRRIIFIAVPHRGSDFADNPGSFAADYVTLGSDRLDSVHLLSPHQPTLRILDALPFPPAVQIHSTIGNRGKAGPLEHSSDGVMPYHSSHIHGVVSEKIVPAGHSCVSHHHTMTKIRQILVR